MNPPSLQIMKLIWGALLASLLLYVVISFTTMAGPGPFSLTGLTDFSDPLRIPLTLSALMALAMSATLPRVLLAAQKKNRKSSEPLELAEMARLFHVPLIIRLALLESITLFGFVLASTKRDPAQILPFAAVSVLGFLASYPSETQIRLTFSRLP